MVKNPPANAGDTGDTGSIPGSGRFPGGGNGNPLQYSSLKNPTDRGAWRTTAQRVTKSHMQLSTHTHTHTHTAQLYEAGATDTSMRTRERVTCGTILLSLGTAAPSGGLAGLPRVSCSQRQASPFLTALRGASSPRMRPSLVTFSFCWCQKAQDPHKTTSVDKATDSILCPSCPQVHVLKPTLQCDGVLRCSLWGVFRS